MVSTKQCVLILATIVLLLAGIVYATTMKQTDNTNASPTIVVNGDGSSGTGDVTNTKIVETKVIYTDTDINNKATGPQTTGTDINVGSGDADQQ